MDILEDLSDISLSNMEGLDDYSTHSNTTEDERSNLKVEIGTSIYRGPRMDTTSSSGVVLNMPLCEKNPTLNKSNTSIDSSDKVLHIQNSVSEEKKVKPTLGNIVQGILGYKKHSRYETASSELTASFNEEYTTVHLPMPRKWVKLDKKQVSANTVISTESDQISSIPPELTLEKIKQSDDIKQGAIDKLLDKGKSDAGKLNSSSSLLSTSAILASTGVVQGSSQKRVRWNDEEHLLFYRCLKKFGLNFTFFCPYLPFKTRMDIIKKYKKEERQNRGLILDALNNPIPISESEYNSNLITAASRNKSKYSYNPDSTLTLSKIEAIGEINKL